ncbi:MAG: hypothetical protein COB92_08225 [Robiginitomaculum sp.]|nr:MAG: hypothetical protein COB92_08225 [Robiginitomaculum sp.]
MFSKNNQPSTKPTPSIPKDTGKKLSTPARSKTAVAPSILSRDLVITGEISTDGDVQIEGRLEGNVKATTLTVGEQGAINGKITAGKVLIRGKVTGKINANSIEMAETANVLADLVQDHLIIANGAFFDGKCTRKTKPPGAPVVAKPKT